MQVDNTSTIKQPLVTVIISSFNHEQYIAQAIESVISQSYKNIELIVIDDGSVDSSFNIINTLVDRYNFIAITRENRGLAKTLNEGVGLANGKYICFLASDDFYLSKRVENAVLQLEKSPSQVAAVYCDGYIVNFNGKKIDLFGKKYARPLTGNIYNNLLVGNWIPALGVTYRAEVLKVFKFDERFKVEDYTLYLRILKNNKFQFVFYNDFDFAYRCHGGNFTNLTELMQNENMVIQNTFPDVGRFAEFKRQLKARDCICHGFVQFKNYYLLYLQAVRELQKKSGSYHRSVFGIFLYYLLRFNRLIKERFNGFRYFGLRGFRKCIRIDGRVHIIGRKSNFQFGHNCRILGDVNIVLDDTWRVKPSITIGNNVTIDHAVYLNYHGGSITAGSNCHFGVGCVLQGFGGLVIGNGVLFGPGTKIFASNHNFKNDGRPIVEAGENFSGVNIGNNIWVGANCTIVDGTDLGDGSIYGAGGVIKGIYKIGSLNIAKKVRVGDVISL
jgi:alpha-1,3-rhamnosyltransferase